MHIISHLDLARLVSTTLLAAGADQRNAERVSEALVSSNLAGVDTHGVIHLPGYVKAIKEGAIKLVRMTWLLLV